MATLNKESAYKVLLKGGSEVIRLDASTSSARNGQKCGEFDVGESVGKTCLGKMAKRVNSNIN